MIYEGSRYTNTEILIEDDLQVFDEREIYKFKVEDAILHTIKQGETLSSLASKYYRNTQYWWVILDANADKVQGIFDVEVGMQLLIPTMKSVLEAMED